MAVGKGSGVGYRRHNDDEWRLFFSQSLRSPTATAAIVPSSKFLARALLRSIDFTKATTVLELGAGTGAVTMEILRRLGRNAKLYTLDVNPLFVSHMHRRIRDRRLVPILGAAENLESILAHHEITRVDAIVSSLGLSIMDEVRRNAIMGISAKYLAAHGVMSQFQYLHANTAAKVASRLGLKPFLEERLLTRYFKRVSHERVFLNVPPAIVFTCHP
jgi:phosphatidylethanolamine/phosphatidyl-N-methylethanolamine N-methyltransferase